MARRGLDPKSMSNNSTQSIITAIKAVILHTCGVQGVQVDLLQEASKKVLVPGPQNPKP